MSADLAEVFTLSVKPDQNVDAVLALAKTLTARGLANGTSRLPDGKIRVLLFPPSAAKYATWNDRDTKTANYDDDRKAIVTSLAASGIVPDEVEQPKPSEPEAGPEEREVDENN